MTEPVEKPTLALIVAAADNDIVRGLGGRVVRGRGRASGVVHAGHSLLCVLTWS